EALRPDRPARCRPDPDHWHPHRHRRRDRRRHPRGRLRRPHRTGTARDGELRMNTAAPIPAPPPFRAGRAHRPGLRSLLIMVRAATKVVARDPAGMVIPIGLPLRILLTSASSACQEVCLAGRTALVLFVLPPVAVMVPTMIRVLNLPSFLASPRPAGIPPPLAVTPVSPLMVLLAQ